MSQGLAPGAFMPRGAADTMNTVNTGVTNAAAAVTGAFAVAANTPSTTAGFRQWFSADSLAAKVVFTTGLVLVLFLLLRVALALVLFLWPAEDAPYLISGILQGTTTVVIPQDPARNAGSVIALSRDQESGMEFTWSTWLFIQAAEIDDRAALHKEYAVFTKGYPRTQHGPALYVGFEQTVAGSQAPADTTAKGEGSNVAYVSLRLDLHGQAEPEDLTVRNVPIGKWFHVAARLQNIALDLYINGTVTDHRVLAGVPKQNFSDLHVFPNETNSNNKERFTGYLADLVYFPYALNIYRLNAIVLAGPSKAMSAANTTSLVRGGEGDYISPDWYRGG